MKAFEIGLLGEMRAAGYLKKQGLRVIERRYRTPHGEIDLIAKDGETLVFIEVKTRTGGRIGEGIRAVSAEKKRYLRFAAQSYLRQHPASSVRFDLVEITAAGLRHIRNAW